MNAPELPLSERFPPVLPRKQWRWTGLLLGVGLGFLIMAISYGIADINLFPGSDWVIAVVTLVFLVPGLVLQLRYENLVWNMRRARWPVQVIYPEERGPVGYGIQMDDSRTSAMVEHLQWVPSGEPAYGLFPDADYVQGSRELGSAMLFYGDRDPTTWTGEWPLVFRNN